MSKKTKKSNTPDNLYQRGGTYYIRYNVGGKKQRRSLGTSNLREAKRLRDQIMVKRSAAAKFGIEEPLPAAPVKTFGQVAEMWLEARQADGGLRQSTLYKDAFITRKVLLPVFGTTLVSAITVEDIERFIGDLRKRFKRNTVACYFSTFRLLIRQAIRRGWIVGSNPLDRLERAPTSGEGRDVVLAEDEAIRLLAGLSDRAYYMSALALYTGLRWGEVHGLAWEDIVLDTDPPTLAVRRSYHGKPKNEASAATVPISPDAAALMRRWRAEQGDRSPWVFPTAHGKLPKHRSLKDARAIRKAAVNAGITKHITPHVFRHTFGTWVYERTGDPKLVQRLMRHASFETTMTFYVHDRRSLTSAVNLLPNLTPKADLRAV